MARDELQQGPAELERLGDEGSAAVRAVAAWLSEIEALLPSCLERLVALSGDAAELKTHPLRAMLHMARRGRLDLDGLRERCSTPKRTLETAAAVGLPLPPATPVVGTQSSG